MFIGIDRVNFLAADYERRVQFTQTPGVFVENATQSALNDREVVIQDQLKQRKEYIADALAVFHEARVCESFGRTDSAPATPLME